jgi:hypothetical protein
MRNREVEYVSKGKGRGYVLNGEESVGELGSGLAGDIDGGDHVTRSCSLWFMVFASLGMKGCSMSGFGKYEYLNEGVRVGCTFACTQ